MAVFGAPIAHSDDPERAVRAALAIRAAMPELGRSAGRAELAHFERSLETCGATGRGLAIYVRGEAGIGKSRLVAEVARLAAERG